MYYKNFPSENKINNELPIDSEIIEPLSSDDTTQLISPHEQISSPSSLFIRNPKNKFPLWLLLVFLGFLGIIGVLFLLKINKKYSSHPYKIHNFGYNLY